MVLNQHGYGSDTKTFFIWEAVSQYLTETAVRQPLTSSPKPPQAVNSPSPMSSKILSKVTTSTTQRSFTNGLPSRQNLALCFDPAEVANFLGEYGWHLLEDLSYEELNNRYAKSIGRNLPSMKIERMVYAEKG